MALSPNTWMQLERGAETLLLRRTDDRVVGRPASKPVTLRDGAKPVDPGGKPVDEPAPAGPDAQPVATCLLTIVPGGEPAQPTRGSDDLAEAGTAPERTTRKRQDDVAALVDRLNRDGWIVTGSGSGPGPS